MALRSIPRSDWGQVDRAVESIFVEPFPSPDQPVLRNDIIGRGLLYPVVYKLSEEQFSALRQISLLHSQEGFYIRSLLKKYQTQIPVEDCEAADWKTTTARPQFQNYLENVLVDQGGRWGIAFSEEWHAIIGGEQAFIADLFKAWHTTVETQIAEYIADKSPLEAWRRTLIEHICPGLA